MTERNEAEGFRFEWDGPALRRRRKARGYRITDVARLMSRSRERIGQLERLAPGALRQSDVDAYLGALAELDAVGALSREQADVAPAAGSR